MLWLPAPWRQEDERGGRGQRVWHRLPRTSRVVLCLAATLCAVLAGWVTLVGGVRMAVKRQADGRGMEVAIGSVALRPGVILLRNVQVGIAQVPGADIHLDRVEVRLSPLLRIASITAHGGTLKLSGTTQELSEQIAAWRNRAGAKAEGGGGDPTEYAADGIQVLWEGAFPGAPTQQVWGLGLRRDRGGESIRCDLLRGEHQGVSLELRKVSLAITRASGRPLLDTFTTERGSLRLDLERGPLKHWSARLQASAAPVSAPRSAPRPTPAPERGFVPVIDAERGQRWRKSLRQVGNAARTFLPAGAELDFSRFRVELARQDDSLELGPGRLQIARDQQRLHVGLVPGSANQPAPLRIGLDIPLQEGDVRLELAGGPITLAALGIREGSFGLLTVDRAEVQANGTAVLSADAQRVTFDGHGQLRRLSLQHPALASEPLRDFDLGWTFQGQATVDGRDLQLAKGELLVGAVRADLRGTLARTEGDLKGHFSLRIPLASCQALLDAVPASLLPLLAGMRMAGTYALDASAKFDTRRPADTEVSWHMLNECRITGAPPAVAPARFAEPWTRQVIGADRRLGTIYSGPGTPEWVPYRAISPYMETAVVICEDSRFFQHDGFDSEAISNSIRENIKARRFFRGASTVSMQLAKNLYLPREKTLSRKLQEAALTVLLEQELSKEQVLELYLNVVEFGPGIYGIGPAARHYFATNAAHLSLGQSLYLASILPSPWQHHFGADGRLSRGWAAYLHKLMFIAHKIRRITDAELEEGLQEIVAYGVPHAPLGNPAASPWEPDAGREPTTSLPDEGGW